MCEPTAIIAGAGLVIGMVGQLSAAEAQADAANARAAQGRKNAQAAQVAAGQAITNADYEASRLQQRADQLVAKVNVTGAAGNVSLAGGTAARLKSDAFILSAQDQAIVKLRGAQKAAAFIAQGDTFSAQAAADTVAASNYETAGALNAMGDLLSGASKVYDITQRNRTPSVTTPSTGAAAPAYVPPVDVPAVDSLDTWTQFGDSTSP